MSRHVSDDLKLNAINYYYQIKNYSTVCNIFDCSERSLKRWIERYETTGNIHRKNRETTAYKIKYDHINFIKDMIKNNPTMRMIDLHGKLALKFPDLKI